MRNFFILSKFAILFIIFWCPFDPVNQILGERLKDIAVIKVPAARAYSDYVVIGKFMIHYTVMIGKKIMLLNLTIESDSMGNIQCFDLSHTRNKVA